MANPTARLIPGLHVLKFFSSDDYDCHLTILINGVRFHLTAEARKMQARSSAGEKLALEYRYLVAVARGEQDNVAKPYSLTASGLDHDRKRSDPSDTDDADNIINADGQSEQSSPFLKQAASDPGGALRDWMLKPLEQIFQERAPASDKQIKRTLEEWYASVIHFYNLFLDEDGSLGVTEVGATEELASRAQMTAPKILIPEWVRHLTRELEVPWYPAKDVTVLRESEEIPPLHPTQVRIADETFFLKMVDPEIPHVTQREIYYLKQIEKKDLHKQFRVPLIKGLVSFEDSETVIMGFVMTEIEDPTPLLRLLRDDIPQKKRDAWAEESKRIVSILHEHEMVWGDAKAGNFMVDKHDNLWIVDFGGSFTQGWIEPGLMETEAGDDMGVERVANALHDPQANMFDAGNGRMIGKLDKDLARKPDQSSDENSSRKRVRKANTPESEASSTDAGSSKLRRSRTGKDKDVNKNRSDERSADEEERRCHCGKPSSGEMIGCDNDCCKHGWFHFDCVGLKEAPKAEYWYCDECKED